MRIAVIDDSEPICNMLQSALGLVHEVDCYCTDLDLLIYADFDGIDCVIVDAHLDPNSWDYELAGQILVHLGNDWPHAYRIIYSGDEPDDLLLGLADEFVLKGRLTDIEAAVARASTDR